MQLFDVFRLEKDIGILVYLWWLLALWQWASQDWVL